MVRVTKSWFESTGSKTCCEHKLKSFSEHNSKEIALQKDDKVTQITLYIATIHYMN